MSGLKERMDNFSLVKIIPPKKTETPPTNK
jgi:hypothetical protein